MLVDNALDLMYSKLPQPSKAFKRTALERAVALYASRGWTGIHNMSVPGEDLTILKALAAEGRLFVPATAQIRNSWRQGARPLSALIGAVCD
jgi:predicted amidohydrolase YtcJ